MNLASYTDYSNGTVASSSSVTRIASLKVSIESKILLLACKVLMCGKVTEFLTQTPFAFRVHTNA